MQYTSPHKYIKNTSTNGEILTEHLLNSSGGPWTPKRTRKIPVQPGRMKEGKKRKEETGRGQHSLWGAEGKERFLQLGKPLHSGEISWNREGASGDQRAMQQPVCERQDRVRHMCMVHAEALNTPA